VKDASCFVALIAATVAACGGNGSSSSAGSGGATTGGVPTDAEAGGGASGGSGTTVGAGGAATEAGGSQTQPPLILSFTAAPASLARAGEITLFWQVQNATSLSINQGVGPVTGVSLVTTVSATTIFTLTAGNASGAATATTAVVVGGSPSSDKIGRFAAMVSPTSGESFVAPTSLRLVAVGRDPTVYTNSPRDGLGGNAAKLQFFVDDALALEVDGAQAEYWVFKGFATGIAAGQHRVWARAIYVSPDQVLDSPPALVEVAAPPTYAQVVDLSADVVLAGATGYQLRGTANGRIRLNGNGHRITSQSGASGLLALQFVDVFDLGPSDHLAQSAADVTTSGAILIEDCRFDSSSTIRLGVAGDALASLERNLFRSNMRMELGQQPGTYSEPGASYPVVSITGGAGVFAGNNIGAGYVEVQNARGWTVGGSSDADSNILIGPRVGLSPTGTVDLRRNYSHHVYFGGWSQGSNFELGGSAAVLAEHNVIYGSSWPVRGVGGQFRYNLVLEAGHQWLWADTANANIHHNVFVGGEADVGGIYALYSPTGVTVANNTIDGLAKIGLAVTLSSGNIAMSSNLFYRVPSPAISIDGARLVADYNLFFGPTVSYSDGRATPAHDVSADPLLSEPPTSIFDIDEAGIWQRRTSVRDVLARYRARYLPKAGSPAIDTGDPAGGAGNDIGAVGSGAANANDKFGTL
jgi:hypothetical protein